MYLRGGGAAPDSRLRGYDGCESFQGWCFRGSFRWSVCECLGGTHSLPVPWLLVGLAGWRGLWSSRSGAAGRPAGPPRSGPVAVVASGGRPARGEFRCASRGSPGCGSSGFVAPSICSSLPPDFPGVGREFRPSPALRSRRKGRNPSSPNGAATAPLSGMRSACPNPGASTCGRARCLSHAPAQVAAALGAIEASERSAVAHGLLRPHSRVSRPGV